MKRLVSLLLLLAFGMTAFSPMAQAATSSSSAGGRLGGNQAGFESKYGKNSGQDETVKGLDYTVDGFGVVAVLFRSDKAVSVTLIADGLQHEPLNEADDMDWSSKDADKAAFQFLPQDVKTNKKRLDTGDGRKEVACTSKTIATAFDKDAWKKLKLGGNPGDCRYLLSPDADGAAYQIEVSLGRAGSLDRTTPTAVPPTPTPQPTDDDIKASYAPLADVRELAIRTGGMLGDKIVFSGPIAVIQVAPDGYGYTLGGNDDLFCQASIQVRVSAPDGSTQNVAVCFQGDTTGMFEDSFVTVYGKVIGTDSGTNAFGGMVFEPLVDAQFVDLGPPSQPSVSA